MQPILNSFGQSERAGSFCVTRNDCVAFQKANRDNYNIVKILSGKVGSNDLEAQISNRISQETNNYNAGDHGSYHIPLAALATRSDLSAQGGASVGGALIETAVTDFIVPALRNKSAILGAGAVILPSLAGSNLSVPRLSVPGIAGSGETTVVSIGAIAFENFTLSANLYKSHLLVSNQLLAQAKDRAIEDYLKGELITSVAKLIDLMAIQGNGVGQATGLLNMSANSGTAVDPGKLCAPITYGTAASFAKLANAAYNLDLANFSEETRTWLISPLTRSKFSQGQIVTGYPKFLLDNDTGKVGPYPALITNQLQSTNQSILIKANEAVVGIFGNSVNITANPYTYASQLVTEITVSILADFNMLRGGAVVSTDSASQ